MKIGLRKPSWKKIFGAYRSQWKRSLKRFLLFGAYGKRGMGWFRDPKRAAYNYVYRRTTFSIDELFGIKPTKGSRAAGFTLFLFASLLILPFDLADSTVKTNKRKKAVKSWQNKHSEEYKNSKSRRSYQSEKTGSDKKATDRSNTNTHENENITHDSKTIIKPSAPKPKESASPDERKPEKEKNEKQSASPKSTVKIQSEISATISMSNETKPSGEDLCLPRVKLFDDNSEKKEPGIKKAQDTDSKSDESIPKSTPRFSLDSYVRKRMIIADSEKFLDESFVLAVGDYFEMKIVDSSERRRRVAFLYKERTIGYAADDDTNALLVCLTLHQKPYGVVTDIRKFDGTSIYEYEAWIPK